MWLCQRPNPIYRNGPRATALLLISSQTVKMGHLSFFLSWSQKDPTHIFHHEESTARQHPLLCRREQGNSSPGMKQLPERRPLALSLLQHSFGTWMFIQSKRSAQLTAGRRHRALADAQHVTPPPNFTFLLASYGKPRPGGLTTVRSASRCHVFPTRRSGNRLNKGTAPMGILSITDRCGTWLRSSLYLASIA